MVVSVDGSWFLLFVEFWLSSAEFDFQVSLLVVDVGFWLSGVGCWSSVVAHFFHCRCPALVKGVKFFDYTLSAWKNDQYSAPTCFKRHQQEDRAPFCKPFKGPKNRFPAWRASTTVRELYLKYRPTRLHRLAEPIPWNWFLGSLKVYKFWLSFLVPCAAEVHLWKVWSHALTGRNMFFFRRKALSVQGFYLVQKI